LAGSVLGASRRAFAQELQPANGSSDREPGTWQSIGATVGGAHYVESDQPPYSLGTGGLKQGNNFITRGAWFAGEAEYLPLRWLAVAVRGRAGWIRRGPATPPDTDLLPGADTSALDPQLADSTFGGTFAAMIRFLPGRTALDAGLTAAIGSFRPRLGGRDVPFRETSCGDCYSGQSGFDPQSVWPTFRVSRTGRGFFFAAGTGEGFVRPHEPGLLELLLGFRGEHAEFMAGMARGLALRFDWEPLARTWLSFDCNVNPFNDAVPGHASPRMIGAITVTRRWSSFAPL
jgi:hypothetical protein